VHPRASDNVDQVAEVADIAIVGAGAAGLFAAIWAGRTMRELRTSSDRNPSVRRARIIAFDGARKLGAKVLVAGGGRCNVTHHAVDESAYAGSSRNAIRNVLRAFPVQRTVEFFAELGVELKREETGKLFPVTDDAHTVLDALLHECSRVHAELRHPWRVHRIERVGGNADASPGDTTPRFIVHPAPVTPHGPDTLDSPATPGSPGAGTRPIAARRVILATGGMALPKSGSDGAGYAIARALGHTITPLVTPALVPITLDPSCFLRELSGVTLPASLTLLSGSGRKLVTFTNSTLLTHFGLSGPAVLDISRYWLEQAHADPSCRLVINFLPAMTVESLDAALVDTRALTMLRVFDRPATSLPERLVRALCAHVGVDPASTGANLSRVARRALASATCALELPVTGSRGYTFAEVTAGGVPLSELRLDSMASRNVPGLYVIGELCDVDGRIGGFNFQWAWASGYLAGVAAARSLIDDDTHTLPRASA